LSLAGAVPTFERANLTNQKSRRSRFVFVSLKKRRDGADPAAGYFTRYNRVGEVVIGEITKHYVQSINYYVPSVVVREGIWIEK
jgi:hypothetical protein